MAGCSPGLRSRCGHPSTPLWIILLVCQSILALNVSSQTTSSASPFPATTSRSVLQTSSLTKLGTTSGSIQGTSRTTSKGPTSILQTSLNVQAATTSGIKAAVSMSSVGGAPSTLPSATSPVLPNTIISVPPQTSNVVVDVVIRINSSFQVAYNSLDSPESKNLTKLIFTSFGTVLKNISTGKLSDFKVVSYKSGSVIVECSLNFTSSTNDSTRLISEVNSTLNADLNNRGAGVLTSSLNASVSLISVNLDRPSFQCPSQCYNTFNGSAYVCSIDDQSLNVAYSFLILLSPSNMFAEVKGKFLVKNASMASIDCFANISNCNLLQCTLRLKLRATTNKQPDANSDNTSTTPSVPVKNSSLGSTSGTQWIGIIVGGVCGGVVVVVLIVVAIVVVCRANSRSWGSTSGASVTDSKAGLVSATPPNKSSKIADESLNRDLIFVERKTGSLDPSLEAGQAPRRPRWDFGFGGRGIPLYNEHRNVPSRFNYPNFPDFDNNQFQTESRSSYAATNPRTLGPDSRSSFAPPTYQMDRPESRSSYAPPYHRMGGPESTSSLARTNYTQRSQFNNY